MGAEEAGGLKLSCSVLASRSYTSLSSLMTPAISWWMAAFSPLHKSIISLIRFFISDFLPAYTWQLPLPCEVSGCQRWWGEWSMRGWVGTQVLEGRQRLREGSSWWQSCPQGAQGSRYDIIQRYNKQLFLLFCLHLLLYMQQDPALPFYQVEDVLDRKLINNKVYYLVKWKDYPIQEATWEHSKTLPYIKPLIRKYNIRIKDTHNDLNTSLNTSLTLPRNKKSLAGSMKIRTQTGPARENAPNSQKNTDFEQEMLSARSREPSTCQTRSRGQLRDTLQDGVNISKSRELKCSVGGQTSEIDLGGQKVSFGLPDSETEEQEEQIIQKLPHQSAVITNKSNQIQQKSKDTIIANKFKQASIKENPERAAVRRMALLHKMDESRNKLEFYLQFQDGKSIVLGGKEMLKAYPQHFLSFVEKMIIGNVDK